MKKTDLLFLILIPLISALIAPPFSHGKSSSPVQSGTAIVLKLRELLSSAETLSFNLGQIGGFKLEEEKLREIARTFLDHGGDYSIAGGGLWYEPFHLDPKKKRHSFFWARNQREMLTFLDNYNQEGPDYQEEVFKRDGAYRERFLKAPGYHNEEWYVIGKHLPLPHKGIWSQSYTDPYSFEPMVTFTSPIRDGHSKVIGVATVDLKLRNLFQLCQEWGQSIGGNIFILDRNGKIISFFDYEQSRVLYHDPHTGQIKDEYLHFNEIIKKHSEYQIIQDEILKFDRQLIMTHQDPALVKVIDENSYQLDATEAEKVVSIYLHQSVKKTDFPSLLAEVPLKQDPYFKRKATSYIFNVPQTHWKVVVIMPKNSPKGKAGKKGKGKK